MTEANLCLGYSRVSSEEQAQHGISIDAQLNDSGKQLLLQQAESILS